MIIGLTGPAGSGKSSVAAVLCRYHGFERLKFAAVLKNMLRMIYESMGMVSAEIERRIEGDLKEVPCDYLCGRTPRHAMQTLGTEWGRYLIHPDFWVMVTEAGLRAGVNYVCDDVRFENEAAMIRSRGGLIVGLAGRGGIAGSHLSEAGVAPDVIISNDRPLEATVAAVLHLLD